MRDHFAGHSFSPEDVVARFGVAPAQLPEFLALAGDSSQNVPGVRGIGAKTAAALLKLYETLAALMASAHELPARQANALQNQSDDVELYAHISALRTDVEVGINLSDFRLTA